MCEPHDPAAEYLGKLDAELSGRGMKCELITGGVVPRLQLHIPWYTIGGLKDSAFEDHILAVQDPDGTWRFWWPWIQPIGPADDLAGTADHIVRNTLDLFIPDDDIEVPGQESPASDAAERAPQLAGGRR